MTRLLNHRRPFVSTLFVQYFHENVFADPNVDYNFFPVVDDKEALDLSEQITQAAVEGRAAELESLIRESLQVDEDAVHLPIRVFHTSALYSACYGGRSNCVKLLLQMGHNVECGNIFGTSPLVIAAMRNHHDVVAELLLVGQALLTKEAVKVAAQWDRYLVLGAMYCSSRLTVEMRKVAWDAAREQGHTDSMECLAKMKEVSPIEYAADMMLIPALRSLSRVSPLDDLKKAFVTLNRSKARLIRPSKDLRMCKDILQAGQKYVVELARILACVRISTLERHLLGTYKSTGYSHGFLLKQLLEMLGIVAIETVPDLSKLTLQDPISDLSS